MRKVPHTLQFHQIYPPEAISNRNHTMFATDEVILENDCRNFAANDAALEFQCIGVYIFRPALLQLMFRQYQNRFIACFMYYL